MNAEDRGWRKQRQGCGEGEHRFHQQHVGNDKSHQTDVGVGGWGEHLTNKSLRDRKEVSDEVTAALNWRREVKPIRQKLRLMEA